MDSESTGDLRVSRSTLATQVERAIRADIMMGVLDPGLRLRASKLAKRYGVSATPLREALQRLAEQKLVELDPRMQATVAPVTRSELEDIYEQRELLEGIAVERAILRGGDAWSSNLTRRYEALKDTADGGNPLVLSDESSTDAWVRFSGIHRAFHDALVEGCGSPWLVRFVGTLSDHSERYRMLIKRKARRNSLEEHRDIYLAAISGDAVAAKQALRRHLLATVDVLEQILPADAPDAGPRKPARAGT